MSGIINRLFGEKVLEANASTGAFQSGEVYHYKPQNIKDYFDAYNDQDLIRAAVDDLAEQTVGDGYFTTVEKLSPKTKKNRAKEFVDDYGKEFNLDLNLVNVTRLALIAGFCPVEVKFIKGPVEKNSFQIVHPLTIDDANRKGIESKGGQVLKIYQKVNNKANTINGKNLAWFMYGRLGNDPRGTSFVRGMLSLINTLNDATDDVDKILKRYIGPLGIWKTRDAIDAIKQAVAEREQGQDIFMGKLRPEDVENPNFPQFIQIDPRVPYWEYLQYLDRRIFSYSRAANLWYFKDATVASAKEMEDIVQRHVKSVQREIKRTVERDIFTPLIELNNLPEVPRMNFGIEPTGIEDLQIELFLTKGLELGFISDRQYFNILRQAGLSILEEEEPEHKEIEEEEKPETEPKIPEEPEQEEE